PGRAPNPAAEPELAGGGVELGTFAVLDGPAKHESGLEPMFRAQESERPAGHVGTLPIPDRAHERNRRPLRRPSLEPLEAHRLARDWMDRPLEDWLDRVRDARQPAQGVAVPADRGAAPAARLEAVRWQAVHHPAPRRPGAGLPG